MSSCQVLSQHIYVSFNTLLYNNLVNTLLYRKLVIAQAITNFIAWKITNFIAWAITNLLYVSYCIVKSFDVWLHWEIMLFNTFLIIASMDSMLNNILSCMLYKVP